MVYKFTDLSRREVEAMLGLQLEDTRVYREAKEEGRQEEAVDNFIDNSTWRLVRRKDFNDPIRRNFKLV